MHWTQLLAEYGYLALLVGCLLEGETILILAGFAAHQGYLSLPLVLLLAFVAGASGDLLFFLLGRYFGSRLIRRLPFVSRQRARVRRLLMRHHRSIIVAVRFMYGLRIAGPIIIGSCRVPVARFVVFNLIGAALWSVLIGGGGYLFGSTLRLLLHNIGHYDAAIMLGLIAALLAWGIWRHVRRQPRQEEEAPDAQERNWS